ncbi:hypothetical protein CA234_17790 [Sphingomonas sp. ABOLE]|uniref:hypothetical protein n=1 Tax=Sphingomonas sp. ABOLE TaxID=1985878 RepID=UPI000F7F1CCD|nr:hypothetical protein [Sphingomonas sp. ABOLE]RSV36771.1 hypothetical protein CA234_17790 [Sphingomonas sp. ABOLE]
MRSKNVEAGVYAILGLVPAFLVRWGGTALKLPTILTAILMLVSAFGCGWLFGALQKRRATRKLNGN